MAAGLTAVILLATPLLIPAATLRGHGAEPPFQNGAGPPLPHLAMAQAENWIDQGQCDQSERDNKEFDLVLFGMGLMGKKAFWHIHNNYGGELRWAVAGRNRSLIHRSLVSSGRGLTNFTVIRANLKDPVSLRNVANRARVILSFAGPYELNHGGELIRAAVNGCAHYLDISTEARFQRRMRDMHHTTAKARGVAIVQAAGFRAMAADFLAMSAAQDLLDAGMQAPTHVKVLWELMNGGWGGTQLLTSRFSPAVPSAYDPYLLAPEVPRKLRVDQDVGGHGDKELGYSQLFETAVTTYAAAPTETPVIRRSLFLKYPVNAVAVEELCTTSMGLGFREFQARTKASFNLTRGRGPTRLVLTEGSFAGQAIAFHRDANTPSGKVSFTKVRIRGNGDPIYLLGPKMAAELALSMALDGTTDVGYTTPTQAVGLGALGRRLGSLFQISHDR